MVGPAVDGHRGRSCVLNHHHPVLYAGHAIYSTARRQDMKRGVREVITARSALQGG